MGTPKFTELEFIGDVKQQKSGACVDIDQSIRFYRHKETDNIYFIDNSGREDCEKLEQYEGHVTTEELKKMLPRLNYQAAHDLVYG